MVGMRDVAKAAGVSLSTVSLVVNNTGYVSADMRAKVESAMRQLNYIPNELARNLYRNRTNTIGVIMPTIAHPFFSTLTAHLQREFAARDLKTLLCSTADTDKGESEYIDMLQRHMMDGIIMAAHTEHPADYWTSIHRPIVAFDRTLGEGVPVVRSDHEQGGRLIARQLIDSGARHVVLVGGPRSQFAEGTTFPRFATISPSSVCWLRPALPAIMSKPAPWPTSPPTKPPHAPFSNSILMSTPSSAPTWWHPWHCRKPHDGVLRCLLICKSSPMTALSWPKPPANA